jgi:hypothetical protein
MKLFYYIHNFYANVLALKTKYFLLTALAIHLCIGKNVKKYRYIAIVIMLYASFLAYQLNKIYGYLWLGLISLFIYLNDILGLRQKDKDEMKDLDVGSPSKDSK